MGALALIVLALMITSLKVRTVVLRVANEASAGQRDFQAGTQILAAGGLSLTSSQAVTAVDDFARAQQNFGDVQNLTQSVWIKPLAHLPWVGDQIRAVDSLSGIGIHASKAAAIAVRVLVDGPNLQTTPASSQLQPTQKILGLLRQLDPNLPRLSREVDEVVVDRDNIPANGLLPPLSNAVKALDSKVNVHGLKIGLSSLRADESGIRELLGSAGERSYLVLQQDPAELRATGGFIGSVGFLDFNNGRMAPFAPVDIEKIDKTATGFFVLGGPGAPNHVDLPLPIDQAFHLPSWELRDANWSPDFPTSARRAEFLLNLERGTHVDGVIAIDPFLIQRLLSVIGPVKLSGSGGIVDQYNFFSTSLYRTELDRTLARKDFVVTAGREIMARVLSLPSAKWHGLVDVIRWGCDGRSLQAFFNGNSSQTLADHHGCGGEVRSATTDGVMVVESNLGGNKDDFWMKRSYSMSIAVRADGSARHTLHLHYYGLSQHELLLTQYHGYTGWLRVYLPPSASLVSVAGAVMDSTSDLGHRVLQGWFYVKFDQVADISIVYDVPAGGMKTEARLVDFYWQKQAGRPGDAISLSCLGPPAWTLTEIRVGNTVQRRSKVTSDLATDREFVCRFGSS